MGHCMTAIRDSAHTALHNCITYDGCITTACLPNTCGNTLNYGRGGEKREVKFSFSYPSVYTRYTPLLNFYIATVIKTRGA